MQRVICIGSASKDIFFPTSEGVIFKTPQDVTSQVKVAFELGGKFRAKNRFESIGGVAANVAIGLSRLGVEAACYSRVGGDTVGQEIKTTLSREGVDTQLLEVEREVQSDLSAIIVIEQTGDRIIFHNRQANDRLQVRPEALANWDWLYVSALNGSWRDNIGHIRAVNKNQVHTIALNPGQHNLKDDPRLMFDFLREVDVLFLNKDEAIELLLKNQVETRPDRLNDEVFLIQTLQREGPAIVALTDGKRGAWASDGHGVWHAPSYEPQGLVDTTGGGDAFGSGFLAAYIKCLSLETCLRYGIINAGNVVGAYGAIAGLLNQETMSDMLNQAKSTRVV